MRKENFFIILIVVFIAFLLRFWNLSNTPPSLSHDEIAIGYNAWSVLNTGKDEYGNSYPLLFRSFDDYKLPGYIYTTAVSEKLFGLNEFSVRFSSAFFGVLTVLATYFLVKELFSLNSKFHSSSLTSYLPLLASFLLAISPWHINFSRAAFEANGSLFFIVLAIFFLFKSLKNPKFFIVSIISFSISIYFYYTARVLAPTLIIIFLIIYKKEISNYKRWIFFALITFLLVLSPLFSHMFTTGLSRINQVSIFQDQSLTNPYSQARLRNNDSILSKIFYNRRIAYLQQFSDNYLKNFAPDFYFANGTGPMGLLYIWELPFFFFGLYLIAKIKEQWKWIILAWFLIVPIVGGLTTGQPNALRTLANAPVASLFSAVGIYGGYSYLKHKRFIKMLTAFFFIIVAFFLSRFFMLYFDYYPQITAKHWGDGNKQMVKFVENNKNRYDHIYVTGDYWRPYIYYLFYAKYSPKQYQTYGSINKIDNIYFSQANWDKGEGFLLSSENLSSLVKKQTLFILSPSDFNSQKNLIRSQKMTYDLVIVKTIDGQLVKEVFQAVRLK